MKFKKLFIILTILSLISLAGCAQSIDVDDNDLPEASVTEETETRIDQSNIQTVDEARAYLEQEMFAGNEVITLTTPSSVDKSFFYNANGLDAEKMMTVVPEDSYSDYIRQMVCDHFNLSEYDKENGEKYWVVKIRYHITPEEQAQVDEYIDSMVSGLENKTEEEKIWAITRKVCDTFTFEITDEQNLLNAINSGKGQCMHYSQLFYLAAKKAGINTRIVECELNGDKHQLNIVELDGLWYYWDVTVNEYSDESEWHLITPSEFHNTYTNTGRCSNCEELYNFAN